MLFMQHISILLIGFSVFYGLVFILTHFKDSYYDDQKTSLVFGVVLILALIGIQIYHYLYLVNNSPLNTSKLYLMLLYLVAPSFYFYSRSLLKAQSQFTFLQVIHFVALGLILLVSWHWAFVLAFVIGSGYMLWLLISIYALRKHKAQFSSEVILLSVVFVVAVAVSILALVMPFENKLFYALYASAIGFAFFIVALVTSYKPSLSEKVSEAAKQTYAVSTLTAIDCGAKLSLLSTLMQEDKLYQQSNLDRQTIATELDLSIHQLSELINTNLGLGFSQYLRQQRIEAAKELLLSQPKASVLSIGLEVGFSSQSNFYEAFKELVGTTPAKFRKN